MAIYRIKNWSKYQHYKKRNPPWIKLHYELMSSEDWVTMDDASRVLAVACMLLASRTQGEIDASERGLRYLERVAYLNSPPDLKPLIDSGFLVLLADASTLHTNARPEAEAEAETEKIQRDTEYPNSTAGRSRVPDLSTGKKESKQTPSQMIGAMAYERDATEELRELYGNPEDLTPEQITAAKTWLLTLRKYTDAELDNRRRSRAAQRRPGEPKPIGNDIEAVIRRVS